MADGNKGNEAKGIEDEEMDTDYFSPALMDCWPNILGNVNSSKDFLSVINASPLFRNLLKNKKESILLPQVIAVLFEKKYVDTRDLFKCRVLNKDAKSVVDDVLNQPRYMKQLIRPDSFRLSSNAVSRQYEEGTRDMNGNPFLTRYCEFTLNSNPASHLRNTMQIFRRFGLHLKRVTVYFDTDDEPSVSHEPARAFSVLDYSLRLLSNIEFLEIVFPTIPTSTVHRPVQHSFPKLKDLQILRLEFEEGSQYFPEDQAFPVSVVQPILSAYSQQLTELECQSRLLQEGTLDAFDWNNLSNLKISFSPLDELGRVFINLEKLNCPKLASLTLSGDGMLLSTGSFMALKKFRGSLQVLRIQTTDGLELVEQSNIGEFPNLKEITVNKIVEGTEWIRNFGLMFPNLKTIRFQSSPTDPDARELIGRTSFNQFPNLKLVFWNTSSADVSSVVLSDKSGESRTY